MKLIFHVDSTDMDEFALVRQAVMLAMLLLNACAALPEHFRAPFLLWAQEGLSFAEVAEALGLAEPTARWQTSKRWARCWRWSAAPNGVVPYRHGRSPHMSRRVVWRCAGSTTVRLQSRCVGRSRGYSLAIRGCVSKRTLPR